MKAWCGIKSWRVAAVLAVIAFSALANPAFSQDSLGIIWNNPRAGMCSARIGDKLFLIGGEASTAQSMQSGDGPGALIGTSIVDAFDFKTNTWDTTIAPLDTPRVYATAVALDDSIYVMGGVDNQGHILKSVEVYDRTTNSWHYTTAMTYRRDGASSVVYGDSIFVIGGGGPFGILNHTVEVYSPVTRVWSLADTLLWGRAFHNSVKIGRYIYVFGGLGSVLGTVVSPIKYIERYDPENGSTQIGLTLITPRLFFAIVAKHDSVYAISGIGSSDDYYNGADLLNFGIFSNVSESSSRLTVLFPRASFVADTGDDGMIYLFGGISPEYKEAQIPVPFVERMSFPSVPLTVVNSSSSVPTNYSLSQNYPNPFNPTTTIDFQVPPQGGLVKLEVFDPLGRRVATLVNKFMEGGKHSAVFEGENLPSGAYIYRLQTENGIIYRKMVLIK